MDTTSAGTATDRQTRREGWTLAVISHGTLHLSSPCSIISKSTKNIKEGYENISGRLPKWYTNVIIQWRLSEVNYLNLSKKISNRRRKLTHLSGGVKLEACRVTVKGTRSHLFLNRNTTAFTSDIEKKALCSPTESQTSESIQELCGRCRFHRVWDWGRICAQLGTAGPEQEPPALRWPHCDLLSESGIELVSEELVDVVMLMEGLIP